MITEALAGRRRFRRLALALAAALMLCGPAAQHAASAGNSGSGGAGKIGIELDGYPLPFPAEPLAVNGTTLVPFRAIAEALGVEVVWNGADRTITGSKQMESGTVTVVLRLGQATALLNGQPVELGAAPRTVEGHTFIPLSFFSRAFGADVNWNGAARTVEIRSPREPMYALAFYAISSFGERELLPKFHAAAFGWSRLDDEGRFTTGGADFRWPKPAGEITPERIVSEAAAGGTLPYLMLFSGDGKLQLTGLLADPDKQEAVIDELAGTAQGAGFQGILLDLEGLGLTGDKAAVRASYNAFVSRVAERAKEAGLKLAIAVHPLNGAYEGYDYRTLGELADELIIMAYAYGDEKSPEPDHLVDEAIRLALKETDKDKLVLGISMASENAQSVRVKIGLAKRYGLKGIAIWRLGLIGEAAMAEMERAVQLRG